MSQRGVTDNHIRKPISYILGNKLMNKWTISANPSLVNHQESSNKNSIGGSTVIFELF